MSPFKHNMRALHDAFRKTESIEQARAIVIATAANLTCHHERKNEAALKFVVPWMERDMKAAGVEPVAMQAA